MNPTHQIERTPAGWYCPACRWTWSQGPKGYWPGVPRYAPEAVPPALQTQRQLRDAGLRPGGPAQGCYRARGGAGWRWLYAVAEAIPLPPLTTTEQAQQDRDWAMRQIAWVARQVRDTKD